MKKADILFLKYNAVIIIVATLMNNMTIKYLVANGYSSSSTLIYRSVLTFLFTFLLSLRNGARILPANIKRQALFMVNAGISLLLLFQSYTYLRAATVSMIQRLDIPAAVLIGYLTGKHKRDFKVGISVFAFCMVLSLALFSTHFNEQPIGLLLGVVAIVMTSYSYILIKRSTSEENSFVIVNTVNIGCILVGIISGCVAHNLQMIQPQHLWIFGLASAAQFLLNYGMAVLYRHHDVERGRRPYLVAALVVLMTEQLWMGVFDIFHTAVIVVVISVIYLITLNTSPLRRKAALRKEEDGEEFAEFN